jgi:K+-sensing histidine kinase KdpD
MPVASGITVIETLRKDTNNATIPVIVITGHDDAEAVDRAYRAGATSFLTKPLNWLLFTPHIEFVLRSGDIENELREASATLAFLSDLKSQMMDALAQEFQGPIKTICGFSQLMEKEVYGAVAPPAYKAMISDIANSAYALNTALLKVMNFGQTLTQHLHIKTEPVLALDAVRTAIATLEDNALRRDVRIVADIAISDDRILYADSVLLAQALRSVIANAVRLSPRSSHVTVRASIDDSGSLSFSAGDTGSAMAPDLVAEVNGTRRPQNAYMSQATSTAVSIKIAKILTEAHRGSLSVRSSADRGNLVSLTLPSNAPGSAGTGSTHTATPPMASAIERLARISAELSADPMISKQPISATPPARLPPALRARN